MVGQGEWIIYRYFLRGAITSSWSPRWDEAVGGEKFKYREFLLRAIIRPIGGVFGDPLSDKPIGTTNDQGYLCMVPYDISAGAIQGPKKIRPMLGDIIFTIEDGNTKDKPKRPYNRLLRYSVVAANPSRGDYGRPEGWILNIDTAAEHN
jgi:hypothetical protein